MSLKSKSVIAALLATFLGVSAISQKAYSYDEDTHFYGTYAMARYAGIRHEVASQIALSAQWMDESYISDPTSMIMLPITGIKKRRLLHFPSSRIVGSVASDTTAKMLGLNELSEFQKTMSAEIAKKFDLDNRLNQLQIMTETKEDHPFASEMLMEGLKRGNLMMASASIHTLEDSFAHAGTPAEIGHAMVWHWPDRPFYSPAKYMRMEQAVFSALVAIRTMLPQEALDCDLHLAPVPSQIANCHMDSTLLADNYAATSAITKVISTDVLKDPEYVSTAIRDLLIRGVKAKYIRMNAQQIDQVINSLPKDKGYDAVKMTEIMMRNLLKNEISMKPGVVNIRYILADMGRVSLKASETEVLNYAKSFGVDNLLSRMSEELLQWKVPVPLSDTHVLELEDDKSVVREKEMELRIRNMQQAIRELYAVNLKMIPNPTKAEIGFAREVFMDRSAETKLKVDKNTTYVTFSLRERNAWNKMIFTYLFPSFKAEDLTMIVADVAKLKAISLRIQAYMAKRKAINDNAALSTASKKARLLKLDYDNFNISSNHRMLETGWEALADLKPLFPVFMKDTLDTHITPSPDNFFYRDPELFQGYIKRGVVKQLLGPSDVWSLGLLKEKARMQAGRPPGQ